MRKVAFLTLGCKVNQSDSAAMEELFRRADYEIVDFSQLADVYVVNTCVVTNVAQNKSKQMIRRAVRNNPSAIIAVCGCYAQTAPEEVRRLPGVHLILGNDKRNEIVKLVEKVRDSGYIDAVHALNKQIAFEEMLSGNVASRKRAYLKIEEGCNQYCSYCIIPYARGHVRSRPLESIFAETKRLVAEGFKEIVLIGIHLGAYGFETGGGKKLSDAVKTVLAVEGVQRLRLGSLESIELEDELITLFNKDQRLCRHLHLPLQSGCDKVLYEMRRPYTAEAYMGLLEKLRKQIPDIAVTTDIIVGFPNESEADFGETLAFVEQAKFSDVHIFPFSVRKGTPAASMPGQITREEKNRRGKLLDSVVQKNRHDFLQTFVGKKVEVLFEQETDNGLLAGLTENYVKVYAKAETGLLGEIATVKIKAEKAGELYGELC